MDSSVHCWFVPPWQSHWSTLVPSEVPQPAASRHRLLFVFLKLQAPPMLTAVKFCAPEPLQCHSWMLAPSAVDAPLTSKQLLVSCGSLKVYTAPALRLSDNSPTTWGSAVCAVQPDNLSAGAVYTFR